MKAHALLGPSSANRWLNCPPSARFEEQQPEEEESPYAEEGTLAHEMAALALEELDATLLNKPNAHIYKKMDEVWERVLKFYEGDADKVRGMVSHAREYAGYVAEQGGPREDLGEYPMDFDFTARQILIESKVDVFDYVPLGFGTTDATVITEGIIYVNDYKYGAGVKVSAEDNPQLKIYGLGALSSAEAKGLNIHTVVLNIFQPRAGGYSSWQIPAEDLKRWGEEEVKPKALQAIAGLGEFKTGEHCRFCRARSKCRAFYSEFSEALNIRDDREIDGEDLKKVLTFGPSLASWLRKVESDAVLNLERGGKIEGFKLVKGKGRRAFKSEADVVDALIMEDTTELFNTSLKSLTEIEKVLGKSKFNELLGGVVIQQEGRPQIAPLDDKRSPVGKTGADEYD